MPGTRVLLVAAVVVTLAGCAPGASLGFDQAMSYQCLHHTIDADVLAAATPVSELDDPAATMLAEARWDDGQALVFEDVDAWYLAALGDESVVVMRNLGQDEIEELGEYGLPGSDREFIEVSRLEGTTNAPDGWYVMGAGVCPLTVDLGGLTVPTVSLDPAELPTAATTELALLVTERDCNSGRTADGRVKLVSLTETEDSVTVTIGVAPPSGTNTCQGNPATPFTVVLDEPLGDRTLIDGTRGAPLEAPSGTTDQ